ncbi:MAG: 30S ribosomal protein S1 [Bacteroidota bacterium]|nr:30S ribosomal protein S1 [Bacteroidota bacterium]
MADNPSDINKEEAKLQNEDLAIEELKEEENVKGEAESEETIGEEKREKWNEEKPSDIPPKAGSEEESVKWREAKPSDIPPEAGSEEKKEEVKEEKPKAEEEEPKAEEEKVEKAKEEPEAKEKKEPAKNETAIEEPSLEDFDWDAVGKKQDAYTSDERVKLEELYDKTLSSIVEHEVINGTVVAKNNREVVVNIGFKSDGVIPLNELRYNPDLKIGDTIEVYVESQEDPSGQLLLSHKKARILKSWERINEAYEKDEIINGYVKCRTKGGLIVDVFGIEAFLPGSQIDVKPIRDYDVFVDKTMEFKVVKINHEFKNVVVSHKALIEAELEHQKAEIMSKLEKGQVLEGTVKNITSYGVFIDLGGVDGLIHITDLSWGRINHPDEIVQLDEKIKVVILDFDDEKKRIALGLKQLTPHPWDALDKDLKIGDKVKGKVVVIADYGAFIEIAAGVEGLIHVSEMSWSQHLRTAQDFLKVGEEVEAIILTLDREERKMSLGMKQLIPDPWANIMDKYPKDFKHTAIVRNFTNFGIFVELEEGVDGLIHISDLSWSKKIKHPAEFTKIGEDIEVVVLDVDVENRRLSLGHKQLEENPWDVFESIFTLGSVHNATILNVADKGAVVSLPYGVEGFVPNRHLQKEDGKRGKLDEALDFKVIEFNKDSKKIILSHTKTYQDKKDSDKDAREKSEQRTAKRTVKRIKDSMEKTTLGDLEALANLKTEIEKSEKKEQKKKAPAPEKKSDGKKDK